MGLTEQQERALGVVKEQLLSAARKRGVVYAEECVDLTLALCRLRDAIGEITEAAKAMEDAIDKQARRLDRLETISVASMLSGKERA